MFGAASCGDAYVCNVLFAARPALTVGQLPAGSLSGTRPGRLLLCLPHPRLKRLYSGCIPCRLSSRFQPISLSLSGQYRHQRAMKQRRIMCGSHSPSACTSGTKEPREICKICRQLDARTRANRIKANGNSNTRVEVASLSRRTAGSNGWTRSPTTQVLVAEGGCC